MLTGCAVLSMPVVHEHVHQRASEQQKICHGSEKVGAVLLKQEVRRNSAQNEKAYGITGAPEFRGAGGRGWVSVIHELLQRGLMRCSNEGTACVKHLTGRDGSLRNRPPDSAATGGTRANCARALQWTFYFAAGAFWAQCFPIISRCMATIFGSAEPCMD